MAKTLVAFFSVGGTTERVAKAAADAAGADVERIVPAQPYTDADLDWRDNDSRNVREKNDPSARPELACAPGDLSGYDTVLLGFPIWWYVAPRIVETWVEAAGLAGKKVVTWATSGGSGMGESTRELGRLAPAATWVDGEVLHGEADARRWVAGLGL
mgnify:CR=1 FL=1